MLNNLANYLLGYTSQEPAAALGTDVKLTAVVADDDWVLVDRDSDSDADSDVGSSLESIPDAAGCRRRRTTPLSPSPAPTSVAAPSALLTRTSSTSSLPCTNVEESWFLTPPPCFTSAGPVHMETSPLENLLIEHPSMSVYQHSGSLLAPARLRISPPSPAPSVDSETESDHSHDHPFSEVHLDERLPPVALPLPLALPMPRRGTVDTLRQQEKQCLKIKSAQKLQIHKACQSLKRGYIERNNKAREVNCRNHRQRRGERSQGSARSNANNNRKC